MLLFYTFCRALSKTAAANGGGSGGGDEDTGKDKEVAEA